MNSRDEELRRHHWLGHQFTKGIYMLFVNEPQGWMQAYSPTPYAHAPKPAIALDSHGYATALTPRNMAI
jgi:hypothetical protein